MSRQQRTRVLVAAIQQVVAGVRPCWGRSAPQGNQRPPISLEPLDARQLLTRLYYDGS